MTLQHLKLPFLLLAVSALSGLNQSAQAEEGAQQYAQTVQTCEGGGGFPLPYVRIQTNTGESIRVHSAPAGNAIGAIPNGWAVRVLEWSRNGYWVKVTNHFGISPEFPGRFGGREGFFRSAPEFREGWVSAGFVKDLGRFCEKPEATAMLLQPALFSAQPVEVQGDWLAMGDVLAENLFSHEQQP
jgi:hypothetical protein